MRKLLSLICSVFVLYSAYVIELSHAELSCIFTPGHPSMISAGMIDTNGGDRGNEMVEIKLEADKISDKPYNLKSCYLLTNANRDDFYKKDKTLVIPMESYEPFAAKAKFRGQARLPKNVGSIGVFKIYCDLPGPKVASLDFGMSLSVWIKTTKFVQESKKCHIRPTMKYWTIADKVTVHSPLSSKSEFTVDIKNIGVDISRGDGFGVFHSYFQEADPITLGTYGEYSGPTSIDCLVNGQKGIVVARIESYKDVKLLFNAALPGGKDYKITCPSITSKIISGHQQIPSILKFFHLKLRDHAPATNIYVA